MKLFAIIVMLSSFAFSSATDVWITQNGAGVKDGTTLANAAACDAVANTPQTTCSFFNNASNWGSGATQIGPGTKVHISGTILGAAASSGYFSFQASGTAGNVITLFFETGALLEAPYFDSSFGAISIGSNNYVLIDGNNLGGTIENTLNGTSGAACPGGACSNQQASKAILSSGGHDIEIRGLNCIYIYYHTSVSDQTIANDGANCFYSNPVGSNISIHDNVMHDASWVIELQFGSNTASGFTFYNNNIYNMDHGIAWAMNNTAGNFSNFSAYSNHIHDTANWDTTLGGYHHDGIHFYNYAGSTVSGFSIYNNLFDGAWGNNNTAHVFGETNSFSNVNIFNNVFIENPGNLLNNGELVLGVTTGGFYNNTFLCDSTVSGMVAFVLYGTSLSVENNVFSGCQTYLNIQTGDTISVLDYNIYSGSNAGAGPWVWKGATETTFMNWKTASSGDSHGSNPGSLGLNSSGVPQSGSAVIGAGLNLTSLGITALDSSTSAGNSTTPVPRPSVAAWDVGAYQFAAFPIPAPFGAFFAGNYILDGNGGIE